MYGPLPSNRRGETESKAVSLSLQTKIGGGGIYRKMDRQQGDLRSILLFCQSKEIG
jgi:hypothetical protein